MKNPLTKSLFTWFITIFIILILLFFILPNIFNQREKLAFSDQHRFEMAKDKYNINSLEDSVIVNAGDFYKRSSFHNKIFGKKYRDLWSMPVKVKVLDIERDHDGLMAVEKGGGMQTIGIDMLNRKGRSYDLRSVNKDQSKALSSILQYSLARFIFRDQAAALNPYASLVLPTLEEAAGLMHTNPQLVFVPYDKMMRTEFCKAMSGRMAILLENPDETWEGSAQYGHAEKIVDTEQMFEITGEGKVPIDTNMYATCRLFDILISDWDRHEGQWNWALVQKNKKKYFQPIPVDRDMAFYKFDDGYLNLLALKVHPRFQSFHEDYKNISGLVYNPKKIDVRILNGLDERAFLSLAKELQSNLTDSIIERAFQNYPPEVHQLIGQEQTRILKSRRDKLVEAAREFYQALNGV